LESQLQALQAQATKATPATKKPAVKAGRPAAKPAAASHKKSA